MSVTSGMVLLGVALICLQLSAPADCHNQEGSCPDGWEGPHRDVCYKLSDTWLSWSDANAIGCQNLTAGAHLASITYSNKAFLSKRHYLSNSDYFWVGLLSGDDKWNIGTPAEEEVDFTNWETVQHQEPSGSSITNDDCVLMVGPTATGEFRKGAWLDRSCDYPFNFLCAFERDDPSVACPRYWYLYDNSCYMLHHQDWMTYTQANDFCSSLVTTASLAKVTNYEELAANVPLKDADFFWIGLRSTPTVDGKLLWNNGDEAEPTNWLKLSYSEPDGDDFGPGNDCVMVNGLQAEEQYAAGQWGDYDCSYESQFLCALEI
ncbi:macrophage mannose receptor 1-like [Amphibalanus amphitrite]|uniref:macrophage mannose receptor 1-like n=1 Tax=Amphibalanus amphitrite TaxID=1232801 RepID=UPI001C922E55|nr:macrophage mannose receptor 1-like [Amphibalanus amphitrite]